MQNELVMTVNVIGMDPNLQRDITSALHDDKHLGCIYQQLLNILELSTEPGDPQVQKFRLDPAMKLMYFCPTDSERLCIPLKMQETILHMLHNYKGHPGVGKTYNCLQQVVYMPHMKRTVDAWVTACPTCTLSKPQKQLPYGQLHPITMPMEPLSVLTMDFITHLPTSPNGNDTLLVITNKFSKAVWLIPGKASWSATEWADRAFDIIFSTWGLPQSIISDQDPKFTSEFWTAIFQQANTWLGITTAYHPNVDGQSEKSNNNVKVMLQCTLTQQISEDVWEQYLLEVEYWLLTSPIDRLGTTPFELLYG